MCWPIPWNAAAQTLVQHRSTKAAREKLTNGENQGICVHENLILNAGVRDSERDSIATTYITNKAANVVDLWGSSTTPVCDDTEQDGDTSKDHENDLEGYQQGTILTEMHGERTKSSGNIPGCWTAGGTFQWYSHC